MSIAEVFSIIKDIFLAGAAAVTAYVAFTGIEKWKSELRGKANFDVARELIKSVYKLRDEMEYCRSPFVPAHEFPEGFRGGMNKLTPEERGQAWAHVYHNRWEPVGSAVQEFDAALLEAEALWGGQIREKALRFRRTVQNLRSSIDAVIYNEYSDGEDFKEREFGTKMRANVSATRKDKNELSIEIEASIKDVENEIRPHLSRS